MNTPFEDVVSRWGLIVRSSGAGSRTGAHWARIAHATAAADRDLVRHAASAGRVRGDAAWCRVAVEVYQALSEAGAYRGVGRDGECSANANLIRAWLNAPSGHVDHPWRTVAESAGFDQAFAPHRQPTPAAIVDLIAEAQHAGVFGVPHHRLQAWDCRTWPPALVVTLMPPDRAGVCTPPIGLIRLRPVADEHLTAIVSVLQTVASEVNQLLIQASEDARPPPLGPGLDGFPIGNRRGFTPMQQHTESPLPPDPQSPPDAPPYRRTRT